MTDVSKALQLLADGGVLDKLKADAQSAREAERVQLLVKLAQIEQAETTRAADLAKVRSALVEKIASLESELQAAKRELNALAVPTGHTATALRGQLRKLSDPSIAEAIAKLSDLFEKARHSFSSHDVRVRKLAGGRSVESQNNSGRIAVVMENIRDARSALEALQEAERPADLDAVLADLLDPIKVDVRRLHFMD